MAIVKLIEGSGIFTSANKTKRETRIYEIQDMNGSVYLVVTFISLKWQSWFKTEYRQAFATRRSALARFRKERRRIALTEVD